jgi:hypothetical protein
MHAFVSVYLIFWNQLPTMDFHKPCYGYQAFEPTPIAHILFSSVIPILRAYDILRWGDIIAS